MSSSSYSEPLSSSFGVIDADTSEATQPLSGNTSPIPFYGLDMQGASDHPSLHNHDVSLVSLSLWV